MAARVATCGTVEWAIDSFAPYKKPNTDGIPSGPAARETEDCSPLSVRIFRACLATGYVPAIRRQVKAVFILKTGRNSCSGPREFRLISLISFLLKTTDRLVDGV